jgi:hypothetical protein
MCFNACTISTCNSGKPKINPTYQNWQIDEEYFQALRNPLKLSFLSFSTEFFQHLKNPLKLSFFLHRICSKRKDPLNLPLCLSFFLHRICSSLEEPTSSFLSFFKQFVKTLKNPLKHSSFLDRICSKRKKTHSRFLSFFTEFVQFLKNPLKLSSCLHRIGSKRKKFPLKHSFFFTGFVLSSSCSFNSTSHSPKKLHRNLRLQSQNLSRICDCCDKDRHHNNAPLHETAEKFAKEH